MLLNTDIEYQQIMKLWDMCFKTYLQYGCKLSFPANTPPQKTYHWRSLKLINDNFQKWELSEDDQNKFIAIAVRYIKSIQKLQYGLSAIGKNSVIAYVRKELIKENDESELILQNVSESRKYLIDKVGHTHRIEIIKNLLTKESYNKPFNRSFNITNYYLAKKISPQYMSLSYSCCKTIEHINETKSSDKALLPSIYELYAIRIRLLDRDANFISNITKIMGSDWRNI